MFEDGNNNGFLIGGDLDLGSASGDFGGFTSMDDNEAAEIFGKLGVSEPTNMVIEEPKKEETAPAQVVPENGIKQQYETVLESTEVTETEENKNETVTASEATEEASAPVQPANTASEQADLFSAVMAEADEKQAEAKKDSLIAKLPIFDYGSATEEIVDTSITFDQLRLEKAEDFPELNKSEAVSWKMIYGTITKQIPSPGKTTIASMKTKIEESKEFLEMLKKPQNKKATKKSKSADNNDEPEIKCKVTATVTMQPKGNVCSYKGVFTSLDDANNSGKLISYIPSDDGKVYEMRKNRIGTFIAEANRVKILDKVRAGFTPALPKIPYELLSEVISFFKSFVTAKYELEAVAYIYWSFETMSYSVFVPKQYVTKDSAKPMSQIYEDENTVLVMEIHSHNTMNAFFSKTDDMGEMATRLYAVVGRLDGMFPDIKVRISVGGKFVMIQPEDIFEIPQITFPEEWSDYVKNKVRAIRGGKV